MFRQAQQPIMEKTIDIEGIKAQIMKEDKSALNYILNHIGKAWEFSGWSNMLKKSELLKFVLDREDAWYKLESFQTYKKYFNTGVNN